MTGRAPHQDFIVGFQEGNFKTVRELYSLHYADLYQFCAQLISDKQEAVTIVTDTFIKLLQGRNRFDNLANIKAFLYITTRNTCLQYLKSHKGDEKPSDTVVAGELFPVTDTVEQDMMVEVSAEIDRLPATTRTVFQRLYCNNEYIGDIAQQLELNPRAILQHKSQALQMLQQEIGKKSPSPNLLLMYYLGIICPEQRLATAS